MVDRDTEVVALGPLRWNIAKIREEWRGKLENIESGAVEKLRDAERAHRDQRRALKKHLKASRDAIKACTPLNGRLIAMRASCDTLTRLGRLEAADKVRRKLRPLEDGFWAKELANAGFSGRAKQLKDTLSRSQQVEVGLLEQARRRDLNAVCRARDAQVKAQQRRNPCSSDNVWSIWSAAKIGHAERLAHLLSIPGANVDARDPDSGWTSLHFASRQGRLGAVTVLIEARARVGARTADRRTPLHLAAAFGTYEVCAALLEAGADKEVLDQVGRSPRDLAEGRHRNKVAGLLRDWEPMGLTATETEEIIGSQEEEPREGNADIRAQLKALKIKRATLRERHMGISSTLGKLAWSYRATGRLKESRTYLEQLVALVADLAPSDLYDKTRTAPSRVIDTHTLALAYGNLGVVCHEMGNGEKASTMFERSFEIVSSAAFDPDRSNPDGRGLLEAVTQNLGLHYLSEGRAEAARPLIRRCLEMKEETLQSDMRGGHESVELIPILTLLSSAEMLAGNHAAAEQAAERAAIVAVNRRTYGDPQSVMRAYGNEINDPVHDLSDAIPRLEWLGVQRFAAGDYESARVFFSRARAHVVQRAQERYRSGPRAVRDALRGISDEVCHVGPPSTLAGAEVGDIGESGPAKLVSKQSTRETEDGVSGARENTRAAAGNEDSTTAEFHPHAMRLDRCAAVAICKQGPQAS